VETQGESDYLKRAGCTEAQGFLFGCPGAVAAGRSEGKVERGMRSARGRAARDDEDGRRFDLARSQPGKRRRPVR